MCGPEVMMRFAVAALRERGVAPERIHVSMERNMKCAVGHCGHCQLGPTFVCRDGPVFAYDRHRAAAARCGSCDGAQPKPKLAVWKFASCDGCQLSLLDCEDELLALAGEVEIAYFLEARRATRRRARTTCRWSRARSPRRRTPSASSRSGAPSRRLVTIGACATAGGIQALRNFADVDEFVVASSTRRPSTSRRWRPRRRSATHVPVDFELHGCPIDKRQLLEVISAFLDERRPRDPVAQRLHRVQAARQRVRDGRPRHAVPGPGDPRRLRRALPVLRPRLLRLLRADGDAEHRRRWPAGCAAARRRARSTWCASSAPSTPARRPFRERERGA